MLSFNHLKKMTTEIKSLYLGSELYSAWLCLTQPYDLEILSR